MIPELTFNEEAIERNWKYKKDRKQVKKICEAVALRGKPGDAYIPVYQCDDSWIELDVFNEFNGVDKSFHEYGYCDTQEALVKYLQDYLGRNDNYFVEVGLLDMENSKYWKFGSYINKNGEDTGNDYCDWIQEHPEDEDKQEFEGHWLRFYISKLTKDGNK